MAEHADLDQIWMVVTPHNPLKKKDTLLKDAIRLELVYLATENYPKIKPSDIEFKLPQPSYTVNTLAYIQEKYPNNEFSLIMGEDNLKSFHKWKNYEVILQNHDIYVYPRLDAKNTLAEVKKDTLENHSKIHFIDAPVVEISATFIREAIKKNINIQPLLPIKVWEYIDHNNLYRK
jgi:nicotinate-nucleotide adenylyltransferase